MTGRVPSQNDLRACLFAAEKRGTRAGVKFERKEKAPTDARLYSLRTEVRRKPYRKTPKTQPEALDLLVLVRTL